MKYYGLLSETWSLENQKGEAGTTFARLIPPLHWKCTSNVRLSLTLVKLFKLLDPIQYFSIKMLEHVPGICWMKFGYKRVKLAVILDFFRLQFFLN